MGTAALSRLILMTLCSIASMILAQTACKAGTYLSGSSCLNCPSGTFSLPNASTCSTCNNGQSSPPGSSTCYQLASISRNGSSCRDIVSKYGSTAVTGWYKINVSSSIQTVYCDTTTDGGVAYTILPCLNCPSVYQVDSVQANGCTALGLKMIIPRSKAHWDSMFNFVSSVLNASLLDFQTVPGIYKPVGGLTPCLGGGLGIMNSDYCSGVPNSWRASDGGQWWIRDLSFSEPNGYGYNRIDYLANSLLGLYAFSAYGSSDNPNITTIISNLLQSSSNLVFDDGGLDHMVVYTTGPFYLCSTNDQSCLPGYYSDTGYEPCALCQPGSSISSCFRPCAAGYFSSTGASPCSLCVAGTYSKAGATFCLSCPAGTYSLAGSSSCSPCALGTSSSGGVRGISYQVSALGVVVSDFSSNDLCYPRALVASIAEWASLYSACAGCQSFIYPTITNLFTNQLCILKSNVPVSGASSSLFWTAHSTACSPCKPGSYSPVNGSSSCVECPAGTFGTAQGEWDPSIACQSCQNETTSSAGSTSCFNQTSSSNVAASSSNIGLIAGVSSAAVFLIVLTNMILVFLKKRRDQAKLSDIKCRAPSPSAGHTSQKLIIKLSEITFGAFVGAGSYGEVFKGTWNDTEVAIKSYFCTNDLSDLSASALRDYESEVQVLTAIRHPNVIQFFGSVVSGPRLSIVTEYMHRGSLFGILGDQNINIDPRLRLKMALDIAKGMNQLHTFDPPIVHRDLKSPNLLVSRDWTVKVADFGLSRVLKGDFLSTKGEGGTPHWMSPEVLSGSGVSEKSDVFSFGVVLFEIVTRDRPWKNFSIPQQIVYQILQGNRIRMPVGVQPEVEALANDCWAEDPSNRPSFATIVTRLSDFKFISPPVGEIKSISSNGLSPISSIPESSPKPQGNHSPLLSDQSNSTVGASVASTQAPPEATCQGIYAHIELHINDNTSEEFKTVNPFAMAQ